MISAAARTALLDALGSAVRFDVPLSRFTSLRVGGAADALASPPDRKTLGAGLRACAEHGVPVTVLGNGFNTLVRDGGTSKRTAVPSASRSAVRAAAEITASAPLPGPARPPGPPGASRGSRARDESRCRPPA